MFFKQNQLDFGNLAVLLEPQFPNLDYNTISKIRGWWYNFRKFCGLPRTFIRVLWAIKGSFMCNKFSNANCINYTIFSCFANTEFSLTNWALLLLRFKRYYWRFFKKMSWQILNYCLISIKLYQFNYSGFFFISCSLNSLAMDSFDAVTPFFSTAKDSSKKDDFEFFIYSTNT